MVLPRLLPDGTALVLGVLRAALPELRVSIEWEADYLKHLPFVWVEVDDTQEKHPEFAGNVSVDVHCFAISNRAVRDVSEAVRATLWRATQDQTVLPEGHLSRYRKTTRTSLAPQDVHGVYRTFSSYTLGTRPPQP